MFILEITSYLYTFNLFPKVQHWLLALMKKEQLPGPSTRAAQEMSHWGAVILHFILHPFFHCSLFFLQERDLFGEEGRII